VKSNEAQKIANFVVDTNKQPRNDDVPMKNATFPPLVTAFAGPAQPAPTLPNPFLQASALRDNDQKIDQSIAYMNRHLSEPLNVAKLASVANISSSHFFVVFKRRTGQAPIDYFIRLRMAQGRRLLEETSMSVKDIASTLGYEDPFYFSRLFKSVNGLSPTDYRAHRQPSLRAA
jgi:AraC-like DNA-binding protein